MTDLRGQGRKRLLGGEEGQGFKQLMQHLRKLRASRPRRGPSASPRTALDLGLAIRARTGRQFGQPLIASFPRVAGKMALMAVGDHRGRPAAVLFHCRAREGWRPSLRSWKPAWPSCWPPASPGPQPTTVCRSTAATGFALEYPISRVLCDARILSIFEGAAEIQAQVIARRLLG